MRILLIGAPGSGKGTQGELLARALRLTHISSGDLLRRHIADRSAVGRQVESWVSRGDLVPDAAVMDMLRKPVVNAARRGGYVLDGFPRTLEQARAAYQLASELDVAVQTAIHLDVPADELIRRMESRGRGAEDTGDIISHRLAVYWKQTAPLLDYYADRVRLQRIDATAPIDEVHRLIMAKLLAPAEAPS